jgi:hypothetical protein
MSDAASNSALAGDWSDLDPGYWTGDTDKPQPSEHTGRDEASDKVDPPEDAEIIDETPAEPAGAAASTVTASESEAATAGQGDGVSDQPGKVSEKTPNESNHTGAKESKEGAVIVRGKNESFPGLYYLFTHGDLRDVKRNSVTNRLEFNGVRVTDAIANTWFISAKMKDPLLTGLTISDFNIYMNSGFIPEYNPFIDWFEANEKYAEPGIIDKFTAAYKLDPKQGMPSEVACTFIKRWLIGAVASIFEGNHNCILIVLVGPKNCGKTYGVRHLIPLPLMGYFSETRLNNMRDDVMKACENFIILVDECDSLTRTESAEIRGFLSSSFFDYRAPYDRNTQKRKRYASFIGTSNSLELINDRANNRRIIPICITWVDRDAYNAIDKRALWAEAYRLYKAGEPYNLSEKEVADLDEYTGGNEVTTAERDWIQRCLEPDPNEESFYPAGYLLARLSEQSGLRLNLRTLVKELGACGFVRARKRSPYAKGQPTNGWYAKPIAGTAAFV